MKEKRVARIFMEVDGKYYVCDEDLDYLDARGRGYTTKAAAKKAAREMGYTHGVGSGMAKGCTKPRKLT